MYEQRIVTQLKSDKYMIKSNIVSLKKANRRETLKKLKLISFFMLIGMSVCYAHSYSQTVTFTFQLKNKTIKEVFKEVEKNSEFIFLYHDKNVDTDKVISLSVKDKKIEEVLDEIFNETPNTYKISDRQILISTRSPEQTIVQQQTTKGLVISGNVTDKDYNPLIGVTVQVVEEPSKVVVTDEEGNYRITVSEKYSTLQFRYVGFAPKEEVVDSRKIINVIMSGESTLEEVVVIGFGTQRKESVIGAISSVSPGSLKTPVGNISTSLAGQIPGIIAAQRTGEPGAQSDFWIRGVSTFGSKNRPLVLVDGIERPLDLVDNEDVESISILKDATATAVYGVKGGNGVVLITTRRGEEGRPIVSARLEAGILSPTKLPKMANAMEFVDMYNDAYRDIYGIDRYSQEDREMYMSGVDTDLYPNVNWMNEIFRNTTTNQRATVNITGGSRQVRYYVSGTFYNENGIYRARENKQYNPDVNWSRFNFRANVDIDLFKGNTISFNIANQYDTKNSPRETDNLWLFSFRTPAIAMPKIFSDGRLAAPGDAGINPYNILNEYGDSRVFSNNMQSLININQDFSEIITEGLKANLKYSWDAQNITSLNRVKIPRTFHSPTRDENGELILVENENHQDYVTITRGNSGERITYFETSLTYDRVFNDAHRVGGMLLFNMRERFDNFPGDLIRSLPYRNMGLAGRVTYSFSDRYFAEWNFGYNGSENFSPNKRFGFFPSYALGYLVSNEPFWESLKPIVNTLKLKASYGEMGNDNLYGDVRFAFNPEMLQTTWSVYNFGEGGMNAPLGVYIGRPGDPNVSWETSYKTNLGIEVELFNQLKVNFDLFKEKRSEIYIQRRSIPSIVGTSVAPSLNFGVVKNKGFDMNVEYYKKIGEVFLTARGNLTVNRNRTVFNDQIEPIYAYRSEVGRPLYQQFGLVATGFFESEEDIRTSPRQTYGDVRVGDIKYKDINGDGIINDNDQIAIGRTHVPEINYGFGFSASWKNFDCSLFFQGAGNVTNFMAGSTIYGFTEGSFSMSNVYADVANNRWTLENPSQNAKYPRISINENLNNNRPSTIRQYDASYMRLKNLELGYTLPKDLLKGRFIESCRVYLQGVNVLTFSSFKLWDPEVNESQGSRYPNMRTFNLGVNFKF